MKKKDNIYRKKTNRFSAKEFSTPGEAFWPVYGWEWDGVISHEKTDAQLAEMKRLGIKSMYIIPLPKGFRPAINPTTMEPDYLTPAYLEEYRYAINKARESEMMCWLYDEGGWPSGSACGKVLIKHPELACKNLACRKFTKKKGEIYHKAKDALGAFYRSGEQAVEGEPLAIDAEITEYFSETTYSLCPGNPGVPDLTQRESTDTFIELTHEAYKSYIKEHLGNTVQAVFFDEPSMPYPVAFRTEIEAQFERENGYSVRPFLPELLGEKKVTKQGAAARIAWFDLTSRLFCENYLLLEKAWSNDNGMAFTGHFSGEDMPAGLMNGTMPVLRALRCLDIPGIDVIWRQIFPVEKPTPFNHDTGVIGRNGIFPRYASSAASQIGSRRVLAETFGVFGAGLTFDEMRYILDFLSVRGVNIYNMLMIPYAREGFQMVGELPFFTEQQACYKDLAPFNSYMERLSYVTSIGRNVSHTALYHPFRDFFAGEEKEKREASFEEIGKAMEDAHIPFDVFDDDMLDRAEPEALIQGKLSMGEACYTTLVIPPCDYISQENIEKLETFIAGGGRICLFSDKSLTRIRGAEHVKSIVGMIKPPLKIGGDIEKIRLGERSAENGTLYLFNNESLSEKSFYAEIEADAYLLNLENGKILLPAREGNKIFITLLKGQIACLFVPSENTEMGEQATVFGEKIVLKTPFTLRKTSRFVIGEMQFKTETYTEKAKPVRLGDWSDVVGIDYSGSGMYKTSFAAPAVDGMVCLDLGTVRYTCETFLNGKNLGVRVMPPYSYEFYGTELQGENILEIRVTNTPANEYNYTRSFDKWPKWMLTSYFDIEKMFQQDSLPSGLYGPVSISYEKQPGIL